MVYHAIINLRVKTIRTFNFVYIELFFQVYKSVAGQERSSLVQSLQKLAKLFEKIIVL